MKDFISRVRRNHGLEHATLNILASSHPGTSFAGHSDSGGFWILGEIVTEELHKTANMALEKLSAGQESLAIHPNCGTNLLVSGFSAGLAGAAGLIGVGDRPRDKLERIPVITALSVLALLLTKPLGPIMQKLLTTSGKPGKLKIISIQKHNLNGLPAHRISTLDHNE
jgi:hypothetical protein